MKFGIYSDEGTHTCGGYPGSKDFEKVDAQTFAESSPDDVLVLKYDMDAVEVLALLRPKHHETFTLADLSRGFKKIAQMLEGRWDRLPAASVSFLGAKSNALVDAHGDEPAFVSAPLQKGG